MNVFVCIEMLKAEIEEKIQRGDFAQGNEECVFMHVKGQKTYINMK